VPHKRLRAGDRIEVKHPTEILNTLDEQGDLEGLPFMPEMAAYCGRQFVVRARADKVCDTVQFSGSRNLPDTVLLDDLRCDGGGHDGCQAGCRFFWKEAWLERVSPRAPLRAPISEQERAALIERASRRTKVAALVDGKAQTRYRCQATEVPNCSAHVRTFDPRAYVGELTSGNVPVGRFLRVMARVVVEEPQRKLGLLPTVSLAGAAKKGDVFETLKLRPGEMVRVKSREEIARTLDAKGMNRGLRFDREMLPFCGQVFKVLRRVERFIDEPTGNMVLLKTDAVILDGAFCAGDTTPARWFCPRGIYGFWRECWLERVDDASASRSSTTTTNVQLPPT
jgi:hypothetical protein